MTLELTEPEVKAVITALSSHPYNQVAALIGKIHQQMTSQQMAAAAQKTEAGAE